MDRTIARNWIEALRSGRYEQGTCYLSRNGRHCCLGVLAEEMGYDLNLYRISEVPGDLFPDFEMDTWPLGGEEGDPTVLLTKEEVSKMKVHLSFNKLLTKEEVSKMKVHLSFNNNMQSTLAKLNDSRDFSFEEIANIIERQIDDI